MPIATHMYAIRDGEQFENLDSYVPEEELLRHVFALRAAGWTILPGGYWSMCWPPFVTPIRQGWKIHIAGTLETAPELLSRLVPVFETERVPFKFCSDMKMVRLSISKNWDRTSAGKFITVYPQDNESFGRLAERCHEVTGDLAGPFILTDRPYQNSKVVFYRYGAHLPRYRAEASGLRTPIIEGPDGSVVPDRRVPYFTTPPWVSDPFNVRMVEPPAAAATQMRLKDGRYAIEGVFRFSSVGGIYYGSDTESGQSVVIREQRPLVGTSGAALEKEARILQKLGPLEIAPKFIDLFEEQSHRFLVQERILADNLWDRTMGIYWGDVVPRTPAELLARFQDTIRKLVYAVECAHSKRIVLRDLTRTNVLFPASDDSVRLIDFELSYELDEDDPPVPGGTFGYRSPQQIRNETPTFADDYFALGALLVDMFSVTASGIALHRDGVLEALFQTLRDVGLPSELGNVARELLNAEPSLRPSPTEVLRRVSSCSCTTEVQALDPTVASHGAPKRPSQEPTEELKKRIKRAQLGITSHLLDSLDLDNPNSLWPCSPDAFLSNPLSLRFGAAGILYYLWYAGADLPEGVAAWIVDQVRNTECPPGYYTGLSGIAVTLAAIGKGEYASEVMSKVLTHGNIFEVPGLYEGAAGWGLANLRLWMMAGRSEYLERAIETADKLTRLASTFGNTMSWTHNDRQHLGLGRGASGISLFYLYLYAATGDNRYLDVSRKAVKFDIAHATELGDRILMHDIATTSDRRMKTPGMFYGTAGVASAAVRVFSATNDESLKDFSIRCAQTLSSRFTNKIWQDWGLAGCGDCLIDAFHYLGDRSYLNAAYYLAEGILPFQMERRAGVAFPGAELLRISCDFGVGSSGIGAFLYRLANPELPRILFPDELLRKVSKPVGGSTPVALLGDQSLPHRSIEDANVLGAEV